jgi:formylglycine-generating enzyme required for sulfatase activity
MSPKRLQGAAQDGRTDQWSLAIMAYEVLTGKVPFRGENWMWQIMALPIPAPQQFDPTLWPEVTEVLSIALAKDPARRYPTCSEFVTDLTRAMAGPRRPPAPAPLKAGDTKVNPKDGLTYIWIPPGTFQMGAAPDDSEAFDAEKPAHQVTITKGFWIGQTPVTQEAWQRVMGNNPSRLKGPKLPVENISWDDAKRYSGAVGMRLLTEAEWEYAARAGTTTSRYGPLDEIAWHSGNSGKMTHEVRQKLPNARGLHDMLGNVWEWTADWYGEKYYQPGESEDPPGPPEGTLRVLRGGSWSGNPRYVRVSFRNWLEPEDRSFGLGFRCVAE